MKKKKYGLEITTKMGKYLVCGWAICAGQPYLILWLNVHDIGIQTTHLTICNLQAPTNEILDYLILLESSPGSL